MNEPPMFQTGTQPDNDKLLDELQLFRDLINGNPQHLATNLGGEVEVSLPFDGTVTITDKSITIRFTNFTRAGARFWATFPSPDDLAQFISSFLHHLGYGVLEFNPINISKKIWSQLKEEAKQIE